MNRRLNKIVCLLLTGMLLAMNGCSNIDSTTTSENNVIEGGFVESELTLPNPTEWCCEIEKRTDGSLAYFDNIYMKAYSSMDEGETWQEESPAFMEQYDQAKDYLSSAALGADGSYFTESFLIDSTENGGEALTSYQYSNAEQQSSAPVISAWEGFTGKIQVDESGKCYAVTYFGEVYQIDGMTGDAKLLFQMNSGVTSMEVSGDYLIATDSEQAYLYQISTATEITETTELTKVLCDLGMQDNKYTMMNEFAHYAYNADENAWYILSRNGITRFNMEDGSSILVMDGSLNNVSAPSEDLVGFVALDDGNFLVQFSGGILRKYTYDPNMVNTIEAELNIYTLFENETISQAIVEYKKLHPEILVKLEIGCSGGVTYEDALKNLNTELLSGEGPDVIVMDYLPLSTYVEKGVLMNLADCTEQWHPEDTMYENLLNTFATDNGMYVVPTKVSIPVLVGRQEAMTGITDLESLASRAAEEHEKNPDLEIFAEGYDPQIILRSMFLYASEDMLDGAQMTTDSLSNFLEEAKLFYDMEKETAVPDYMYDYCVTPDVANLYGPTQEEQTMQTCGFHAEEVTMQQSLYGTGCLSAIYFEYEALIALNKQDKNTSPEEYVEGEISDVEYCNGSLGSENRYFPQAMLGVSCTSDQQELALEFIKVTLSKETQSVELPGGLPVNADALYGRFNYVEGAGAGIGCSGWDSYDGTQEYFFYTFVPSAEEQDQLNNMLLALDAPVVIDEITRATILELAPEYMKGNQSLEDTTQAIMDEITLRLAE